ncbi:MAG TPA: NlpC/P60 family protein [Allosphingosinicella sp.]|nr:NlpC/P60 family protein [Allosphingosinicella sp.]
MALDPRLHAYRHDLADIALAGRVLAPHYAKPVARSCGAHPAFVRLSAADDAEAVSELLPGEGFAVLEYAGGWAWGYCEADHVVGYVEAIALTCPARPTHIVCERCAPVAADSRITSPVLASLPMGSRLCGEESGACLTTEYGCVSLSHLRRLDEFDLDPVVVAERLIGTRYVAGGRSYSGIDSAGLVQLSLSLCGLFAPRLPEEQRRLGEPVPPAAPLRRGDLILFDGDAGLMVDDLLMIHACPAVGKVTVDPVAIVDRPGVERRRLPL